MKRLLFISLCALLMSCVGENNISREYECYFVFDTSLHPLPCQLTGILGNPGHFAKVESSMVQGVRHLKTTRNYDNATEDIMLRSEKESKTVCELGANNCIIVELNGAKDSGGWTMRQLPKRAWQHQLPTHLAEQRHAAPLRQVWSYLRCQQRDCRQWHTRSSTSELQGSVQRHDTERFQLIICRHILNNVEKFGYLQKLPYLCRRKTNFAAMVEW